MSKAVAIEGDTQEVTSTAKHPADTDSKGSWSPGTLVVTRGEKVTVNGKKVELKAEMTWTYNGGSANNIQLAPAPTDSATLVANPTNLTDLNQHILVDGDEAIGSVDAGNKIIVTTSQEILKTNVG